MKRLKKLRDKLSQLGLEAILISQPDNRLYLSGFTGSYGYLLISSKMALLLTDFRYVEQAKQQSPDFEVIRIKGEGFSWLPEVLAEQGVKRLGLEAQDISLADYESLKEVLAGMELVPTRGIVEGLRAVKEKEEIELIERAVKRADEAMEYVLHHLHPGKEEREVAWMAEKFLRENGSEPLPFEIIVACGLNSALPHARPTSYTIGTKMPIIIDLGAKVKGYVSDLTRTFFLDGPEVAFHKIYEVVLSARKEAVKKIKPGISGEEADSIARQVIEQAGYKEAFGHGLGHGIGLSIHEAPKLGPGSKGILEEGMVFTIEPGIYLPEWGGVRIEDVVLLEKTGVRILSHAKNLELK